MTSSAGPNKYSHVSRKVFDKHIDRIVARLDRQAVEIRLLRAKLEKTQKELSSRMLAVFTLPPPPLGEQ